MVVTRSELQLLQQQRGVDRGLRGVEWEAEHREQVRGAREGEGVHCVEDVEREEGGDRRAERCWGSLSGCRVRRITEHGEEAEGEGEEEST